MGRRRLLEVVALLAANAIACGGSGSSDDAGTDASIEPDVTVPKDAGSDVVVDAEQEDVAVDHYVGPLAPYARMPIIDYGGGRLLTSVKVVTVTFAGDDTSLVGRLQAFDDTITSTPWWAAATSEYCEQPMGPCIGPGTGGGHVVLNETAAASYVDHLSGTGSTVVQFIQDHVTSGAFPPPDAQTIYVIYWPPGTNITLDNEKSCNSFGAYHYNAPMTVADSGTPVDVAYAIEPRCNYGETFLTQVAAHELIEAATDTDFTTGYIMNDQSWCREGCEVGDLCEHPWGTDVMQQTTDAGAPFQVQRGWSNVSALAGHDPCVIPPTDHPYFNTAPQSGDQVVYLAVGESTTIEVQGFSDGTLADWSISAIDITPQIFGGGTSLTFSLDKNTINNGQTANLTITLTKAPQQTWVPYVLDNKDSNGHEHQWGADVYLK